MEKTYQFPALPEKCKGCGRKQAGKRVELGYMRGSQPMGYCPDCGIAYPLDEIEPDPAEAAEAEAKAKAEAEEKAEAEAQAEAEAEAEARAEAEAEAKAKAEAAAAED